MDYAVLEPFGAEYEANLARQICATIANFSSMYEKDQATGKRKAWYPSDFIPNPLKDPDEKEEIDKKQTPQDHKNLMMGFISSSNREGKKPPKKKQQRRVKR